MADIPSIKSLKTIKDLKRENKAAIYDIVLGRCSEKIIETNKQTDATHLYFELPKVIIGYPNYNLTDCGEYMANKLREKGYRTKLISNEYLYIDWSLSSGSKIHAPPHQHPKSQMEVPESTIKETKNLLKKYPNTSEVVFVYTDTQTGKKKKKVKKKK